MNTAMLLLLYSAISAQLVMECLRVADKRERSQWPPKHIRYFGIVSMFLIWWIIVPIITVKIIVEDIEP